MKQGSTAGRDVTKELCKLLQECPGAPVDFTEKGGYQDIAMGQKDNGLCKVAPTSEDYENMLKDWNEADNAVFEMPDKSTFTVTTPTIRAPEMIFNTTLIGKPQLGGHQK